MRIEIVYPYPPDADARQAAEELAALDVLLEESVLLRAALAETESDERRAEIEAALDAGAVEELRRPDLTERAARREELRFTVRARAYLDRRHFATTLAEGGEWFAAQTGQELDAAQMDGEAVDLANLVYFRAGMLASVDRERTPQGYRYLAHTRTAPGGEWIPAQIPPEWTTLDGMCSSMPLALFQAWNNAARELNPGAGDFFGEGAIRVRRSD